MALAMVWLCLVLQGQGGGGAKKDMWCCAMPLGGRAHTHEAVLVLLYAPPARTNRVEPGWRGSESGRSHSLRVGPWRDCVLTDVLALCAYYVGITNAAKVCMCLPRWESYILVRRLSSYYIYSGHAHGLGKEYDIIHTYIATSTTLRALATKRYTPPLSSIQREKWFDKSNKSIEQRLSLSRS